MRKIDRHLNLKRVTLLNEIRYLEGKNLNESFHGPDGTPIGVDSMHRPMLKRGDAIVWIGSDIEISGERITNGSQGEYIGRESSGEEVVEFGSKRFQTSDGKFKKIQ